ncbi:YwmB family TATA-box binding protein [Neomoorella thermoacetica]|uniref:YwmB family TATA-box binding protein n=1 Tax=Neomoorella thermoacetica TaxID=1525 RepID=UPI0008FA1FB5|nr:YwmB family TATA-box binding protein [Moorella thermoacetica]OIQ12224.1 hypothetical protein MOOTH_08610 [Moorella thermoacetica]
MFRSRFHSNKVTLKTLLLTLLLLSLVTGLAVGHNFLPRAARKPLTAAAVSAAKKDPPVPAASGDDTTPRLLFAAFNASGARLESMHLEAWGRLNTSFSDAETVAGLARQAAGSLGLEPEAGLHRQDTEKFHGASWEGELQPGVKLYLSVQSLAGAGDDGETYLLIELDGEPRHGEGETVAWQEKVRAAFRPWQVDPHLTYGLTGVIPGKLTRAEREQRAGAVLAALEAKKVEGVEDEELLSISAYSARLPRSLAVAGREVNVNVALRFHATDGNTYLHLGSPLLGGEY